MSNIQARINSWRNKEISDLHLLRDLVEHKKWYLPVTNQSVAGLQPGDNIAPAIRLSRNERGEKVFCIFSDMATFNTFQNRLASPTGPDAAMEAEGTWIFGRVLDDFASFMIDPYSPSELSFERLQYKLLNDTAAAVMIERKLKSLRDGEVTGDAAHQFLSDIKNYPNFYVILNSVDGVFIPVMYRSDQNVPLMAVFTSKENARLFYEQLMRLVPGTYSYEQHTGLSIAEGVIGSNFQGLVFNPGGTLEPVPFTAQFAHVVKGAR
jgi:hypothetical protein